MLFSLCRDFTDTEVGIWLLTTLTIYEWVWLVLLISTLWLQVVFCKLGIGAWTADRAENTIEIEDCSVTYFDRITAFKVQSTYEAHLLRKFSTKHFEHSNAIKAILLPSYEPSWLAVLGTRRKNKIQFNSIHTRVLAWAMESWGGGAWERGWESCWFSLM